MPPLPYRPLGPLDNLVQDGDRILLRAGRGLVEFKPVAPGILRVRVGRGTRLAPHRSWAILERGPDAPDYHLERNSAGAQIQTEGLTVAVQYEPLRFGVARPGEMPFMAEAVAGSRGEYMLVRAALRSSEHVYGLGEKTGWFDKRHRQYRMRNTDVGLEVPEGIGLATDPLYASFPIFIVHGSTGSYGVFVDNPEFTTFDFALPDQAPTLRESCYEFAAPARVLIFFVLAGPTPADVVRQYTYLTGRPPLPPLWALGYHQCRWGYRSEQDFRTLAAELRNRRLPADALWFDIDYMDGFRVFTWNRRRFPHPEKLIADLKAQGLQSVTIVDPGVKIDTSYSVYQQGQAGGHFLRHPDGTEYSGSVWPGPSAFPDFHRPETQAWWGQRVRDWLSSTGVAGLWNDMNEPASTDISGPITEVLHAGGTLPHHSARNTYGLQMARATYAAMLEHAPDTRPFILTRAAFSGAQTVSALWCGDNGPHWEHLAGSLPMLLNLGLSGMPFVGVDIGGFSGDTHGELLARWFQAGAFYPFCRNHAMRRTNPHEPWVFGPEVEAICRRYLELRYQLLPYTYCLFYEATQTGAPLMRPLVWHYPQDAITFNLSDQFLYGPELLVAPITQPGLSARAVYLPRGTWYRWGTDERTAGPAHVVAAAPLAELPLYVRGGALVPMWPVAQHTGAVERDRLSLHVWPGGLGRLDFYEDDGATRAYTRGGYRLTPFRIQSNTNTLTLSWGPSQGDYPSPRPEWGFVFHDWGDSEARLDGEVLATRRDQNTLVVRAPDDGARHVLELATCA